MPIQKLFNRKNILPTVLAILSVGLFFVPTNDALTFLMRSILSEILAGIALAIWIFRMPKAKVGQIYNYLILGFPSVLALGILCIFYYFGFNKQQPLFVADMWFVVLATLGAVVTMFFSEKRINSLETRIIRLETKTDDFEQESNDVNVKHEEKTSEQNTCDKKIKLCNLKKIMSWDKHKIIIFIGLGLLIGGLCLMLVYGLPILLEVNESIQNPQCSVDLSCRNYEIIAPFWREGQIVSTVYTTVDFSSLEVFSVENPVHYKIDTTVSNSTYIKKIYFIIAKENENLTDVIQRPLDEIIADYSLKGTLIDMQKSSEDHFHREGSWTTSDKAGYVLVGITQDETGKLYLMPTSQSALFRLVDHSQFLDTINNRDQKNLNKQVLALTLMGVTLAPTLFGAEMVLRGFLKD